MATTNSTTPLESAAAPQLLCGRKPRPQARAVAVQVVVLAAAGVVAGVAWRLADVGVRPPSAAWQVAVAVACVGATAAATAAAAGRVGRRAFAGTVAHARPAGTADRPQSRRPRAGACAAVRSAAPTVAVLVLLAMWLDPFRAAPRAEQWFAVLARRDRLFDPAAAAAGAAAPAGEWTVTAPAAAGLPVSAVGRLTPATAPALPSARVGAFRQSMFAMAGEAAAAPSADADAATWAAAIDVGAARWPVAWVPPRLAVDPGELPAGRRTGLVRVELQTVPSDPSAGFPLAATVPRDPVTGAGIPAQGDGEHPQTTAKAVGGPVAELTADAPFHYHRMGVMWDSPAPARPLPMAADQDALLVSGVRGQPGATAASGGPIGDGDGTYTGAPLMTARYPGGTPRYKLERTGEGLDLLAESGRSWVPNRFLRGLALTWRSRRHAAPGALAVPADPAGPRPVSGWRAAVARALPLAPADAVASAAGREAAAARAAYGSWAGTLVALAALGLVAWQVARS